MYDRHTIYPYGLVVGDRVVGSRRASQQASNDETSGIDAVAGDSVPNTSNAPADPTWTAPAHWTENDLTDLARVTRVNMFRWPEQACRWAPGVTAAWLNAIIARAEYLHGELRLVPEWPAIYADDEYSIVLLSHRDRWVRAWVGNLDRDEGCVAAFDPVNWDIAVHDQPAGILTAGLGIALFTDLALGLHQPGERRSRTSPYLADVFSGGLLLRPADQTPFSPLRTDQLPEPHRVRGFIRRLPDGFQPNREQVSLAPSYVRRKMGPQDTFVRPHLRGSVTQGEILSALKHTTNLRVARASLQLTADNS